MLKEGEPTSSDSESTEAHYAAVSPLAIVALSLGVASALALAHPLMWWLPPVAALAGVCALRSIGRSKGALTGKGVAFVAICLSVFFAAWALGGTFAGDRIQRNHAKQIAEKWLAIIQDGDYYQAHQWTVSTVTRQRGKISLADFYESNADARQEFQKFNELVVEEKIAGLGEKDRIEFRRAGAPDGPPSRRAVDVFFDWYSEGAAEPQSIKVAVERRKSDDIDLIMWRVLSVELND